MVHTPEEILAAIRRSRHRAQLRLPEGLAHRQWWRKA